MVGNEMIILILGIVIIWLVYSSYNQYLSTNKTIKLSEEETKRTKLLIEALIKHNLQRSFVNKRTKLEQKKRTKENNNPWEGISCE